MSFNDLILLGPWIVLENHVALEHKWKYKRDEGLSRYSWTWFTGWSTQEWSNIMDCAREGKWK